MVKIASNSGLNASQADALRRFKAGVFQVLAHPTRIHVIELLKDGEVSVSRLLDAIGVEPANLSQHLSILRGKGLVVNRKDGNQVLYSLRDDMLIGLLDTMRKYFQADLQAAMSMLKALEH